MGIPISTRSIPGEPKASQESHHSASGQPLHRAGGVLVLSLAVDPSQTRGRDGRQGTPEQDRRVTPAPASLQLLQVCPTAIHLCEFLPTWEWGQQHHLQPLKPGDTGASPSHQDLELEPGVTPCCTLPCREQERKSQRRGKLSETCIFFLFNSKPLYNKYSERVSKQNS